MLMIAWNSKGKKKHEKVIVSLQIEIEAYIIDIEGWKLAWTNAKTYGFRNFFQNLIIFFRFGITLSSFVPVEMKHTVFSNFLTDHSIGNLTRVIWVYEKSIELNMFYESTLYSLYVCFRRTWFTGIGLVPLYLNLRHKTERYMAVRQR